MIRFDIVYEQTKMVGIDALEKCIFYHKQYYLKDNEYSQKMSHYPSNNINPGRPLFCSTLTICIDHIQRS